MISRIKFEGVLSPNKEPTNRDVSAKPPSQLTYDQASWGSARGEDFPLIRHPGDPVLRPRQDPLLLFGLPAGAPDPRRCLFRGLPPVAVQPRTPRRRRRTCAPTRVAADGYRTCGRRGRRLLSSPCSPSCLHANDGSANPSPY